MEPGPYKVGVVEEILLQDAAQDSDLPVKVRYPKDAPGPLPVVIFSHGAGGSGDAFPELTEHWASYGYVVLLPTHADSIQLRRQKGERVAGLIANPRQVIDAVRPMQRLADVKLILDSLGTFEEKIPALKGADGKGNLDRERIGMAGHSAGALTTQIAAGVLTRTTLMGGAKDVGDKRIRAAILISGQGTTNRMFTKDSWSQLDKPMLVITGSLDSLSLTHETPESREEPYDLAKAGDKYLLFIEGATHSSYAGKATSVLLGEKPTSDIHMITDVTAAATLAFLDAYVGGDERARARAKAYLESEKIVAFSGKYATWKRK